MNPSYWQLAGGETVYPALDRAAASGVTIIGGGLAGLTAAYCLASSGCEVTLLEAGRIAGGTSGRNTGKLTVQHDAVYSEIEKRYGPGAAREYLKVNERAAAFVKRCAERASSEPLLSEQPSYLYAESAKGSAKLQREYEVCRALGMDVKLHTSIPFPIPAVSALELRAQYQYDPYRYCVALAALAVKSGARIYEQTRVMKVKTGTVHRLTAENGAVVETGMLLFCSHYPFYHRGGRMVPRLKQERSYLIAGEYHKDYPGGMFINLERPVRSFRLHEADGKRILLVGGSGHRTGETDLAAYDELTGFAGRAFGLEAAPWRWSAQDCMTFDSVPFVGRWPGKRNILFATGFNKWGNTGATAAGMMLSDLVLRGKGPGLRLMSPGRVGDLAAAGFYQNAGTMTKDYIKGELTFPQSAFPKEPDTASVVTIRGKRCGCYRDPCGKLFAVELRCPHLGCILAFNPLQHSWDCPCHGSRFSADGRRIQGPAVRDLKRVRIEAGEDAK